MVNRLCHFEIGTRDIESARKFYTTVFDWKIETDPNSDYTMIETGEEPKGGLLKPPPEIPLGITSYIQVENVEQTLEKIKDAGGAVIKPKEEIPNMGWYALFMDPDMNMLGIFEALKKKP